MYKVIILIWAGSLPAQNTPLKVGIADPEVRGNAVRWALLNATPAGSRDLLGTPSLVADFGADFQTRQYQLDGADHDEASHVLVFRKKSSLLVSVARNYAVERAVDELFPGGETGACSNLDPAARYDVRYRRLPDGWTVIAMGISKPRQKTSQVLFIRTAEIEALYPWIWTSMKLTSSSVN